MPPTPSLLRSVLPPPPPPSTSPLHKLTLLQHLSPAVASPCLSKINVHSHHAQDRCDTSDNSNNNLLSLPDSDNDDSDDDSNNNLTSKSNLSDQNHVYDRVSDTFKG